MVGFLRIQVAGNYSLPRLADSKVMIGSGTVGNTAVDDESSGNPFFWQFSVSDKVDGSSGVTFLSVFTDDVVICMFQSQEFQYANGFNLQSQ